ncbi:MAG: fimbrillin family protein [Bacteroidaceae bacterium]|nr:fimbrillin family protein [Bacteroidaceae bacterium]
MKKSMFIAAVAAMVLAGCTKDESIVEQQEIGFQPLAYKASQTKVNVITGATYGTDAPSFGLFAYQLADGKNFDANKADAKLYIDNKEVSYTDENWRTNPKSFWPLQGSLTFIAYSPYSINQDVDVDYNINVVNDNAGNVTSANSVLTISNFVAGTTDQKDLMWSTPTKDKTANETNYDADGQNATTYNGVPILFNHALCRIKITAKTADDYSRFATYNLKQIQVVGLKDNATLTVTGDDVAEWSVAPSTPLADFDFYKDNQLLTKDSNPVIYKNAETAGDGLLAIPQSLDGVTLKVTYTMTVDPNDQVADDEVVTETTKVVTLFKDDVLETLEQNKVYTLNLSISANEILYSPDVNDWEVSYNHDQDDKTPDVNYGGDYVVPQQ